MLINRVITFTLILLSVASPHWKEVPGKPCKPGCVKRGNCNRELGTCECDFGWVGDECQTNLLSSCQTGMSRDGSQVANFIGHTKSLKHMKSCVCWLQLRALELELSVSTYAMELWKADGIECYERDGNVTIQYSDPPTASQPNVTWKQGPRGLWRKKDPLVPSTPPSAIPGSISLPQDQCPDRCHERGTCSVMKSCSCAGGWKGRSCEEEDLDSWHCLRSSTYSGKPCNGRGKCRGGFCHCDEGFWGLDCSRSLVFELINGTNASLAPPHSFTQLKIYRYELPWQSIFHYPSRDDTTAPILVGSIYWPFEEFIGLLATSSVKTENICEANMFFIPLMPNRHPAGGGNIADPTPHLRKTIEWVRHHYPLQWNRYGGKDHFFWLTGDLGACWLPDEEILQNPIKIVHWGLEIKPKDMIGIPGSEALLKSASKLDQSKCFKAERDVCVPNWIKSTGNGPQAKEMWEDQATSAKYSHSTQNRTRKYTLMFSGGIYGWKGTHGSKEYSGGVRQDFFEQIVKKGHPDVLYVAQGAGPEVYHAANFCLAPYGMGWGSRLPTVILAQCIPVIIQDYVYQPFYDILPYESFSVILRKADIPHLMEILRSISPESITKMRSRMGEIYKSFYWSPELGGEAFNRTLESLWRRRVGLFGGHYKF